MSRIIYEAVNHTLKEIFISSTVYPIASVQAAHQTIRPIAISHWRLHEHQVEYREIESNLADQDVKSFIEGYIRSMKRPGWEILFG